MITNISTPNKNEVEKYLKKWDSLENYVLQESALDKLFFNTYPENKDINDILIKASSLNDFYSTNIFSIFPVAKHIQKLNIDKRLKNFDESLLSENGINVLDYLSDGSHQENFLEEVGRFGDQELSNAYKSLFDGDAKVIEKENDFKTLLDNNEHVKLVKECISKNKFSWLEKLLKKKEIDWFAEKMIAEIGNPKLIAQLISRKHLGWSAQNVIAEFNNDDWTAQIIKKQQDLSPYFKSYVITHCNDDILTEMVKKAFLSFDELELIVEKKRYFGIKEIVEKLSRTRIRTCVYFVFCL